MDNPFLPRAYKIGASITGFLTFFCCWIYCVAEYGFFVGVCVGWIPSAIAAVVLGALWPIVWLLAIAAYVYISSH
jgi:hypothetical protein